MIKTETMLGARPNDSELVAASLAGNHDAFRRIVERYQTLICSLAYCATGNVNQSEDLAQETFVAAWKDLAQLREPAKLRSWLCAIVRFRVSNQFRRQGREPVHSAGPLEEVDSTEAPQAPPSAQAITNEETALLWRSLEQIPEFYREPLVLFYREHQSIEAVAAKLDLTEDAVKQRLSRGRKMLQEQVLAFVEGALGRTNPGQAFTLSVLAALPATIASSTKAAMIATAAAKGGAAVKGAALGTVFGLPLVHCRCGKLPGQKLQPAVGWIAFGEIAHGILFASGAVAVGGISIGGASVGLISFGGFGFGLITLGGVALGGLAMGGGRPLASLPLAASPWPGTRRSAAWPPRTNWHSAARPSGATPTTPLPGNSSCAIAGSISPTVCRQSRSISLVSRRCFCRC